MTDFLEITTDKFNKGKISNNKFSDTIELEKELLVETLSESSKERLIRKYNGIFFTGKKHIDKQILGAMLSLKQGTDFFDLIKNHGKNENIDNNKFEKLLFILRKIIQKEGSGYFVFLLRIKNLDYSENIQSTLLTAIDKYTKEDLEKLLSFKNITFGILEKLNGFNRDQRNQMLEIMDLLQNEVGTQIFPALISPNDLENIKNNISLLKTENFDNKKLFSNDEFNACLLSNIQSSMIDFLAMPSKYFRITMQSIGDDLNMLSFGFLGANDYLKFYIELKKRNLSDDKMVQILSDFKYKKDIWPILFFMDKGLPLEKIKSVDNDSSKISYEQCSYLYDNLTQDPDKLLKLFEFQYDTLMYIYNHITQDVDEILNDYGCLKNIGYDGTETTDEITNKISTIYENIEKYEGENAKILFKRLINNFGERLHYKSLYGNIAFFCKYFTNDILNRLKKDEFKDFLTNKGYLKSKPKNANLLDDNFYTSATFLKGQPENFQFLYETGLFTTIEDFNNYFILFYMDVSALKYLYEKGLCTTREDFIAIEKFIRQTGGSLLRTQFDNIKYLYEEGVYTTLNDIISEENFALLGATNLKNIKFLRENNICNSINDFLAIGESLGGDLEIKEFLYKKGICTTLNDFIELGKSAIFCADYDIIEYAWEKGICTTLNDFVKLGNTSIVSANFENFEYVHTNGICTTLDDFIKNDCIITYGDEESLNILKNLHTNNDYDERTKLLSEINNISCSDEYKNEIVHKTGSLPISTAKKYVKTCETFDNSSSPDIQVVKDSLIMDVLNSDNPEELTKKIDTIFMESDIPLISKIFQIFKYVYTKDIFEDKLNQNSSPYLQSCSSHRKRLEVIYQDLMSIMIKSGESSLKDFIQSIISCKQSLYDFENGKTLDNDGRKQVLSLMKKIISLNAIINGNGISNIEILKSDGDIDTETLKIYYHKLKQSLLINSQNSLYNFFLNLCKKIGYSSLENIIKEMNEAQIKAHNNGLSMYDSIQKGQIFNPENNYFLKGIESESLGEILNRGVTSTEYLGGGEGTNGKIGSNGTPFDTDGVMIKGDKVFETAESHTGYGNLNIIIDTNKPQIYNTDTGLEGYNPRIYEIFKNHGEENNYYGIRTGIASTQFNAIIYKHPNSPDTNQEEILKIKYLISKNGFYLPIFDLEGNLLFTPEEYHKLRQSFSFSDKYQGCDIEQKHGTYTASKQNDRINKGDEDFNNFIEDQKNGETKNLNIDNETMAKIVFDKIKDVLESELGIKCNQNKNLLGAELYDSGSTCRGTEIPSNDIDLDFTLLLNAGDYKKLEKITKVIHEKIGTIDSTDHSTVDGKGWQIKSSTNTLGEKYGYEKGIRFDLLIMKKTQSYLYPSNIAMKDRLEKIEELYSQDTLDFVKENIVIMKKLLKSQGTYKNTEGGMGGIGVENRIMQHHGNFIEALETFEQVAYGGTYEKGKENISFDEFKNLYTIRDSGQNFKDSNNDNYIRKMNEDGYKGILNIIKKYRTEGLNGLSELIKKYEEEKSEFIN